VVVLLAVVVDCFDVVVVARTAVDVDPTSATLRNLVGSLLPPVMAEAAAPIAINKATGATIFAQTGQRV
jgi:hypothetical protein